MATWLSSIVLGPIRTLFDEGRIGTMTDEQLLERFIARRAQAAEADEAADVAFEVVVMRHGPMVLGVCRRILRDPHEVEDAFQATFLILARRAGSIRKGDALGGWLRKVAHRVAAKAKALSVRRGELETIHRCHHPKTPARSWSATTYAPPYLMRSSSCRTNTGCRCNSATSRDKHTMTPRVDWAGRSGPFGPGSPGRGPDCGHA